MTYEELRKKALTDTATPKDRMALFNWMEQNCMRDWNGEFFNIDDGLRLYPIYKITYDEHCEIDEIELVDAEIKEI